MAMRSAIHSPDTKLKSRQSMASALLLWDKLRVIVPFDHYRIDYDNREMAEAWELVGKPLVPDEANKQRAHQSIADMLDAGVPRQIQYRDDLEPEQAYEIWPQKLSAETWYMLQRSRMTTAPLANGDYPFEQEAGIAIMAKLADACAGSTFARVTDKMLAYGLIADRNEPVLAQSHVVPLTLNLIDANAISLGRLIDFRRREAKERRGGDYAALRHSYADAVQGHVARLREVQSANERDQLNEEFQDEMSRYLNELERAVGLAKAEVLLKPVVVSAVVGAAGFFAAGPMGGLAGCAVGAAGPILQGVADMFSAGIGFSEKQRKAMDKNPMAYMYQLARA